MVDESEIKRKIMDNYGFVDTEHDRKYHRPQLVNKKGVSYEKKDEDIFHKYFIFTARREEDDSLPRGQDRQHEGGEVQPGHQGGV